jgi:hypothetical protein
MLVATACTGHSGRFRRAAAGACDPRLAPTLVAPYNDEVHTLDLQAERDADYRIVRLAGQPAAIGRTHATYLRPVKGPFRPWPWEADHDFLRACVAIVSDVAPWLPDELGSFAEQVGMAPEQGLFVRAGALNHGCSAVVWRAPNGHILAGRTYDFYIRMRTRHLLHTAPEHGYHHLSMNGGLVGGRYDGVNEHGLFVALHKVMADRPERHAPGIPYHLLPRIALQKCRSAREAADLIERVPHLASFNYTLGDPSGAMIVLECYPGHPVQRREHDHVLAVTNHYTAAALAPLQGKRTQEGSRKRQAALERIVRTDMEPWAATVAAIADHDSDVCCHREFGATLWAGAFDLTARRAAYCFGAPCRNPLQEFGFPGETR